jgi:SNF2 family DNA or RNA helicase
MSTVHLSRAAPGSRNAKLDFPYSPEVNDVIRLVPGREWNKTYKVWLIPLVVEHVLQLKRDLAKVGWQLEMPRDIADELNLAHRRQRDALAVRDAGDSDIAFDYVTEPYAHQRAGLGFLVHLGHGALLWEMGLGKTKTAIDYAEWLKRHSDKPQDFAVLVIAPNTVKRNWGVEITKHAGHSDWVVPTGTVDKRLTQVATETYTIINCEALSLHKMATALRAYEWDLVIVDESTRFKTPEATRTKNLAKLRTKHRVILTGTPITGKPQDAFAQFEWVAPGTFGKSYWAFKDRFLDVNQWTHEINGIKPGREAELRERIDRTSYRILKADVLDLPEKVYTDRWVTMVGEQRKAYDQMRDELRIELDSGDELRASNVLTMLLRLTQVTAGVVGEAGKYQWIPDNAKVKELDAMLDELGSEPVVIFGQYQFELERLAARYTLHTGNDYVAPIIYGPTPEKVRHELVEQFQRGDRRLLFCQTRTGGIGINLTAAKTAIYVTRSWGLEEYLQSQDRLHRIGQTGTVSIVHLVAEESIDVDIADALKDKRALADYLTGDGARALAAKVLTD